MRGVSTAGIKSNLKNEKYVHLHGKQYMCQSFWKFKSENNIGSITWFVRFFFKIWKLI